MMSRIVLTSFVALTLLAGNAEAETLTLAACLQKAATANHELKVSALDKQIAEQGIGVARSGWLPRLNAHGGYTLQKDPQAVFVMNQTARTQQENFAFFSVTAEQTLYDFGRTAARHDRAQALRDAAHLSHSGKEQDVFLQVVHAYYAILEYQKLLQAADEEVLQMGDHLRMAKNLFEQGVVTRNDLLQAEVQLANSKQRRLMEANRLDNSWLYLNYLTGSEPTFRAELQTERDAGTEQPAGSSEFSPDNRAEIQALRKGIAADTMTIKENRSFYFPELFTRLGADYVENDRAKEQTILYATVGLRVNLFDGLATTSRYRQAVRSRMQDEERLRMLEAQVALEYATASNDARIAAERITTTAHAVRQGEENLRINKNRYQEHVGTATDVIDAQTLLTRTKSEYYRAVFDHQIALARIKKAKGER
jgi:outer membrane protein